MLNILDQFIKLGDTDGGNGSLFCTGFFPHGYHESNARILCDGLCQLPTKIHIDQTGWTMILEIPTKFCIKLIADT